MYPVNPRTVEQRRAPSGAKTDPIDASVLANTGRADFADLRRLNPESEQLTERNTLTRDQDALVQMQTRLVTQLTACLTASSPVALEVCGQLHHLSTLAFLRASPTLQAARAASVEELATTLTQARDPGARLKAQHIALDLQQPCLSASEVMTRTTSRLMLALITQLEPLLKPIAEDDEEIERLVLRHADSERFQSVPRAGQRLASRLLAALGEDRARSDSASRLQALAGTSPVLFQSGASRKAHRRLGGITPWRHAWQQVAWQRPHFEPWATPSSQRKRAEGTSHPVAVRALATLWARVLSAVWNTTKPSQSATCEQARQAHAPRVA